METIQGSSSTMVWILICTFYAYVFLGSNKASSGSWKRSRPNLISVAHNIVSAYLYYFFLCFMKIYDFIGYIVSAWCRKDLPILFYFYYSFYLNSLALPIENYLFLLYYYVFLIKLVSNLSSYKIKNGSFLTSSWLSIFCKIC